MQTEKKVDLSYADYQRDTVTLWWNLLERMDEKRSEAPGGKDIQFGLIFKNGHKLDNLFLIKVEENHPVVIAEIEEKEKKQRIAISLIGINGIVTY